MLLYVAAWFCSCPSRAPPLQAGEQLCVSQSHTYSLRSEDSPCRWPVNWQGGCTKPMSDSKRPDRNICHSLHPTTLINKLLITTILKNSGFLKWKVTLNWEKTRFGNSLRFHLTLTGRPNHISMPLQRVLSSEPHKIYKFSCFLFFKHTSKWCFWPRKRFQTEVSKEALPWIFWNIPVP